MQQISQRRFKLYNAGDRIQTTFCYSNPNGHDDHCICRFALDAGAQAVFTLPEMIDLGGVIVHVHFADDVMRDFGQRGVIMIDANYEAPKKRHEETGEPTGEVDAEADDNVPIAATLELAKAKGERKWREHIDKSVRAYLDQCEQIRSAGGVPVAASGAVKRFLKLAGIVDPADAMLIEARKQVNATEALQQTIKELTERLARVERQSEPQPTGARK